MDAWTLLTKRLRTNASGPFVTYINNESRVELSAITVENGAAKVANALFEEFDLEPGARLWLDLPAHWQRTVWCAGAWAAGCTVLVTGTPTDGDLVVTTLANSAHLVTEVSVPVTVVSLHPFGLAHTDPLPAGCSDATVAVRQQPDILLSPASASDAPALIHDGGQLTQHEVLEEAAALADTWSLLSGGRLLSSETADPVVSWLASFAVPLVRNASVVIATPTSSVNAEGITAFAA